MRAADSSAAGGRGNVGGLCFSCGFDLVVFLPRDLFIGDQDLVTRQVGLGFGVVGFRFGRRRGGGIAIVLGRADRRLSVGDVGLRARHVADVLGLRNGDIGLLRGHLAARLRQLRP